MTDAKRGQDGRLGPYRLGRQQRSEDPGMEDLGRLYEAHDVHTEAPALVLLPGPDVGGELEEDCRVRITVRARPPCVGVELEHAPASGRLAVLGAISEVLTRMVERMEWSDEARGHLMRRPERRQERWAARARRMWGVGVEHRVELIILALVLYLCVAHWRAYESERDARRAAVAMAVRTGDANRAPTTVDTGDVGTAAISYPLPEKPFSDQAKVPCKPNLHEVEINGGCWLELALRPPCGENYAEYRGKCYVPVSSSSRKPRPPQAIQP